MGKNLTFISQLDRLDFALYKATVLPRVLEQVVSCKDDIAQQYLLQVGHQQRLALEAYCHGLCRA